MGPQRMAQRFYKITQDPRGWSRALRERKDMSELEPRGKLSKAPWAGEAWPSDCLVPWALVKTSIVRKVSSGTVGRGKDTSREAPVGNSISRHEESGLMGKEAQGLGQREEGCVDATLLQ